MKRNLSCSDSFTQFLSRPLEGEMKAEDECIYGGGGGDGEETGEFGEKKRRLSNHQVKSLEKMFEVDNKLDPDRKVKVAQDLGLQPRQVAIWFQNRRARWKTKQLERDYTLLKSNYDALKHNYHKLEEEKETIIKELVELKAKLRDETSDRSDELLGSDPTNEIYTSLIYEKSRKLLDLKDGFSDSDSSGVLNEENMATFYQDPYLVSNAEEESCNIFLVDQAPNLCCYFRDHIN